MRIPLALTLPGAVALAILFAPAPALAAPIEILDTEDFDAFGAQAFLNWDGDYGQLTLDAHNAESSTFIGGFDRFHSTFGVRNGPSYHVGSLGDGNIDGGTQRIDFPDIPTVTQQLPDHTFYLFAPGATWYITNLLIHHGDGSSHRGNFSATLGEVFLETNDCCGSSYFRFHDGQWDPETAAMFGLPGHDIYGINEWFLDFNEDDFGQDDRLGIPFGHSAFAVPEPGLVGLLLVGGVAAWRRRRQGSAR